MVRVWWIATPADCPERGIQLPLRVRMQSVTAIGWLALSACNQTLGLHDVTLQDAIPIDAPFACVPIGTTPRFSPVIHELIDQDCDDYLQLSSGLAMGTCYFSGDADGSVSEGQGDSPLDRSSLVNMPKSTYRTPRPSPDGDLMLVTHAITTNVTFLRVEQHHREGAAWVYDTTPTFNAAFPQVGELARTPAGSLRVALVELSSMEEWEYTTTWTLEATYTAGDLGLDDVTYASLSEDGLRMLVTGTAPGRVNRQVFYTDRPDGAARFRPAEMLDNVPASSTPYLSADCARIYISGLDAVFYVQQL